MNRLLVVGPSWVGDMLMSQALYRRLKADNPDIQIDVLAPDWCRAVLSRMPEVNQAIVMPVGHGSLQWGIRKQVASELALEKYDSAIVLPNSLKSALIPWMAKISQRRGWHGEMRYGLLNDRRKLDKDAFPMMVQRYAALAEMPCDSADSLLPVLSPQLHVDSEHQQLLTAEYGLESGMFVAFCPGAEFGPAKRWPDYHYAELAEKLIGKGFQVVLFGSAKDAEVTAQILSKLKQSEYADAERCVDLAGKTSLQDVIDLLAASAVTVSNDSGLMHIAAAVNVPVIALYGPTSPGFTPPLSEKAEVIRLIDGFHKIRKGDAEQGYHQSMIDITPELVLEKLQAYLPELA
ncbi:lipopolysaccharide heptosyltransferase II [Aliamphritea ceti]|uniref:lipopolysaccharide heptosyltransferase II n=1 Tax=Aliamphritea ceti TaxID=1524258 RepID=UPI0021C3B623|nr:lipopolysaccharide heptosyltransferase II [Aliamphritea ceti]